VSVRFAWVGDPAEGERCVAPMLAAGSPVLGGLAVMPYGQIGTIHNDPEDPMPVRDSFALLDDLPPAAVEALLAVAGPDADSALVAVELRCLGGAIARPPETPSAFVQRDAAYTLFTVGIAAPPALAATLASTEDVAAATAPWRSAHTLPNFEASDAPDDLLRKYGRATLTRLAELADRYDPASVIRAARPVRAAAREG
jgi:hypothetical protein